MNRITEKDVAEYIDKLENQNEFKSELISTSAHQVRTSLTANKWALRMILNGDAGPITKQQKELLTKLADNNDQMIRSVTELIDVNHTEDSHPKYKFSQIDLHDMIERSIADFHGESVEKDIAISFDETSDHHTLIGDEQKLRTVFQALVENALKYSEPGGSVMIHIETQPSEVVVSVKDEGIGIPKDEQKNIFKKFYRADNAVEKQSIGSGLGLFSANHVIQAHGGRMWFDSVENEGTTFYISLPFHSDETIVE